jgi:hypothetical protein
MPKQKGTHRLLGTTGDMTYQKTKDGYTAREKTHISADKIRTSDSYARTRENMAEFGRAGKASKVMRAAFAALIKNGSDTRMTSRLTTTFLRVLRTDPINDRGQRIVTEGEMGLLEGFDFNLDSSLFTTLATPYTAAINRLTGQCTVNIPDFILKDVIKAPEGSTHARIVTAVAEVDFVDQKFISDIQVSANLSLSDSAEVNVSLTPQITPQSALPLFLILGVQFIQVVNAKPYPLNNGAFNPLALVKVDEGVADPL